ncbi:hypothetical protein O181_130391 [Austropuccinia psidii MF-1]|uniref:Uncharacterized protein n=1 Tax=Austropuccinia psidii MF-1 TaxID=1389203 RepID=A0A9Q3Q9E8_9BASI|nr:hypothetical protein [Austropuccinia psidii MF-1]
MEDLKGPKNKNKRDPSRFEIIESQSKRRGSPQSKATSKTKSRSQSIAPSQFIEVDSSEDSDAALSNSITPSASLPSST